MPRILGIDYGTRRVGFALSDPTGFLATPHSMAEVQNDGEARKAVLRVLEETSAEMIVMGLPVNMDGSRGHSAERVLQFKSAVEEKTTVPIKLWDERLTSKTAEQALIEAGTRRDKRRGLIDKVAAAVLLQHYLDAHPGA